MNTFKTTACLLSLVTAGFAIEDRTPPHTPVRLGNTFAEVATPVQDFAALNIGSPVHHLAPQQLFPVTPQNGGQPNMFVTPQGQAVENQAPNAPGRVRRVAMHTPGSNLDYLASTMNSEASPEIRKRSNFGDVTILDPKGRTVLTTAKKKKGESSSLLDRKCGSPTGMVESVNYFDRLETSGRTPSVHPSVRQFTTGKSMAFISSVDPVLEDNGYFSEEEIFEEESNVSIVSAQNTSMGSFVIYGQNPLGANGDLDDSSFVIRGANLLGTNGGDDSRSFHGEETGHLNDVSIISEEGQEGNDSLNASVVSEAEDDDALSEIGDENSVDGDFDDIDARYPNDYFG